MRVLFVTSECLPYVKTGGLADVSAALPQALRALDDGDAPIDVRLLLPGYPAVLAGLAVARTVRSLDGLPGIGPGHTARLLAGTGPDGDTVLVLDAPVLFDRPGNPYLDADGRDRANNHLRFAALSKAAAIVGIQGDGQGWRPDILHGHDWQAGLAAAYLRHDPAPDDRRPGTVFTIHNLAFQGLFPHAVLAEIGLPPESWHLDGVEFWGKVGFLKAGIAYADRITTVSPTYAEEIKGEAVGFGLDGLLRHRADRLTGILNGVDTRIWNPADDPLIACRYDAGTLEGKAANRAAVRTAFGLDPTATGPLFVVVSRLTGQKGIDLVVATLPRILAGGGQLAVLGTGDPDLERAVAAAVAAHPGRVGLARTYDEALSHRMQAGGDVILVPSRFEPCGLTQMYGLRYGTLPLVSRVGGLADTVSDETGFVFAPVTAEAMADALDRVFALWARPADWRAAQRRAMARDVGWAASARRYADLYRGVLNEKAPRT